MSEGKIGKDTFSDNKENSKQQNSNSSNSTDNENLFCFRETIKNTVEQTISGFSEQKFRERFNTISIIKKKPKTAKVLLETFKISSLNRVIMQLDSLIKEEKLDEEFAAYSCLIEENGLETENVKWRPPGNVKLHLRSPFILQKLKRKQELEQYVISKESEVLRLQNEVKLKRNKISIETELIDIQERSNDCRIQIEQAKDVLKPILITSSRNADTSLI